MQQNSAETKKFHRNR